jgi:hypothetical protein
VANINACATLGVSGCGAAWLARLLGVQEVPGSNPGSPTNPTPSESIVSGFRTLEEPFFYPHNSSIPQIKCGFSSRLLPSACPAVK